MSALEVLEFKRIWWKQSEIKRTPFARSFRALPTRYCQKLNQILETKDSPKLVNRLRRIQTH
ncbi:DUF3263 domain-containing protein [Mycobacteroides abscessus]|uniref:DUF3263 domain-containing protein n=1 Tax=Mycobacteroides abscessus TaxID=36809 RepID=UPI0009A72036|nr:DUF3263 domain-containing protein [Mycobacteroides abscessus]MDO3066937.1 DUF3263 domain-containing protein [Mycobacteroides abscessus subsp. bolletii]